MIRIANITNENQCKIWAHTDTMLKHFTLASYEYLKIYRKPTQYEYQWSSDEFFCVFLCDYLLIFHHNNLFYGNTVSQ